MPPAEIDNIPTIEKVIVDMPANEVQGIYIQYSLASENLGKKAGAGEKQYYSHCQRHTCIFFMYISRISNSLDAGHDIGDADSDETLYQIKWIDKSYMHNTWESEDSLRDAGVKGLLKLQNYIKDKGMRRV